MMAACLQLALSRVLLFLRLNSLEAYLSSRFFIHSSTYLGRVPAPTPPTRTPTRPFSFKVARDITLTSFFFCSFFLWSMAMLRWRRCQRSTRRS